MIELHELFSIYTDSNLEIYRLTKVNLQISRYLFLLLVATKVLKNITKTNLNFDKVRLTERLIE